MRQRLVRMTERVSMDLTGTRACAWLAIQETSAKPVSWPHTMCNRRDFILPDIDECDPVPCQNGGTCVDGINEHTCDCIPGHTGVNCETGKPSLC